LGTLLLRLEIIATTYHSTTFKTHVFSFISKKHFHLGGLATSE
jgi:hypothetical protein